MQRSYCHRSGQPQKCGLAALLPLVLRPALCMVLSIALCVILAACTSRSGRSGHENALRREQPSGSAALLPRADPGYLQWLERQSMLGSTQELTGQVSGTDLIWRNSASARRVPLLLTAAPNWFDVNPHSLAGGQPALRALAQPGLDTLLTQVGFGGLFLAPTGEKGDIWSTHAASAQPDAASETGDNVTSLRIDPTLGAGDDFNRLAEKFDQAHMQMGGELPPAATGLGPDFILQARRASRFDGLYAMMAVPQKDWSILPTTAGEWDCLPLRETALVELRKRGIIPDMLRRDGVDWATPGGWAVTGEIRGADGQVRRWVYRYSGNALRPVLLWQDPSGQARRVFSASVIQHTGLQQQTLAGIRLEPLMGLDAQAEGRIGTVGDAGALVPGIVALESLAGEVHRYGGWAVQDDILPPSLTRTVLATAVDFSRDSITPAAAGYALLSGDAAPLAALLKASLATGVDHSRLARGLRDRQYVDWRPLLDLPDGKALVRRAQQLAKGSPDAYGLPVTQAELSARALGLDDTKAIRPESTPAMESACLLLLSWRMGLPGLTFLSPQDITGALGLPQGSGKGASEAGGVALWATSGQAGGQAPAPLAFGPLDMQWSRETSFARQIARILQGRRAAGLAGGRLVQVTTGPTGCVATLSSLPGGGYWLLAANFSDKKQHIVCPLPADAQGPARDVQSGQSMSKAGRALEIDLEARQARHVLLGEPKTHEGAMP
ncbi:MAG: hypothetical protein F8N36_00180 [Desulfovibrio sp.]|uniref:hypothetical protein n=1 Tax=Desulfovibrio sp. TaxID=885 RepID=UPI00135E69A4|nr:hypothetical protein [Desulfovibrio sp.]MTJ91276.1 hypothetical protein [Desulfovibrio sp.]